MTDVYQVEKIVGKRWKGGRVQYKVKWEGYPYSQCTWEPLEHLQTVFELIDQYNESQQTTSKKSEKDEEHLRKKRKKSSSVSQEEKSEESSNSRKIKSNSSEKKDSKDNSNKEQNGIANSQDKEFDGVITIKEDEIQREESAIIYKKVITVNKEFKAVVQIVKDGVESQITIPTSELRRLNPDILIDFYESKIKFTSRS